MTKQEKIQHIFALLKRANEIIDKINIELKAKYPEKFVDN